MRAAAWAVLMGACVANATPVSREAASVTPVPAPAARPALPSDRAAKSSALDGEVAVAAPSDAPTEVVKSTSIGSVTNGHLKDGAALPLQGTGFRFNERRHSEARFGTTEVVDAIVRAAQRVHASFADSELVVNDVSLPQGGKIAHHGSHRAGRDADILFYLRGDDGQPIRSVGAPIDPEGIGFDYQDLSVLDDDVRVHFDAERTWLLVASLLENERALVQRIFVAEHLRSLLLREAARVSAPPTTVERFADITCQPSYPHDDHLHVRWFCSVLDLAKGCEDLPPLYPFREAELAAAGVPPVLAKSSRSLDPAPVTSQVAAHRAVARKRPHANVLAFLARRKTWEKQPHPGRKYCR